MKLNNKGFAITAVLYGLLILFVVLVSSYLLVLSARKNRVDNIIKDMEEAYKEKKSSEINNNEQNNPNLGSYTITIDVIDSHTNNSIPGVKINGESVSSASIYDVKNQTFEVEIDPVNQIGFVDIQCDDNSLQINKNIDDSMNRDIAKITISNITKNTFCEVIYS